MIPAWLSQFDASMVHVYAIVAALLLVTLVPGLMLLMRQGAAVPAPSLSFGFCTGLLSTAGLAWFTVLYSLAFGPSFDPLAEQSHEELPMSMAAMMQASAAAEGNEHLYARGGWIGNLDFALFGTLQPQGNTDEPFFSSRPTSRRIPHTVFEAYHFAVFLAAFGSMLAVLTVRLAARAAALAALLWAAVVYAPAVHWLWGEGWLSLRGGYDAGGGLLFLILGSSAGAAVFCMRRDPRDQPTAATDAATSLLLSVPARVAAAGLLVAGVVLLSGTFSHPTPGVAGAAIFNTLLALCTACTVAGGLALLRNAADVDQTILRGLVIGLATIAGGGGLYLPASAVVLTLISTIICCGLFNLLNRSARLAPLAFALCCLLLPSAFGLLGVGVFGHENYSVLHWNGEFVSGLAEGNMQQFRAQVDTVAAVTVYCGLATGLISVLTAWLSRRGSPQPDSV